MTEKYDFLGHVRIRIDHNKPLHSCLSVHLDEGVSEIDTPDPGTIAADAKLGWPAGSLGMLFLIQDRLIFDPRLSYPTVRECLVQ